MPERKRMSPWLLGCGIGCGLVLLIIVGIVTAGSIFIGRTVSGFNEAVDARDLLDERYGPAADFTPPADGIIPGPRLEAFLAARDATAEARENIAGIFVRLPMSRGIAEQIEQKPLPQKISHVLGIAGTAMSLGIEVGNFFNARNRAMLDAGVGMGEYTYIYALAYYAWLGHPPNDGPAVGNAGHEGDGLSMTSPAVRRRIHDELLSMLENQREALPSGAPEDWRRALDDEIELMEDDPHRVPWEDGLPAQTAASLEPYRERLESAYNGLTNPLELARNRRRGRFSFTSD